MYIFYVATNKIIKKFRPILKFASVKLIVFATYYQSLFVKASSMSPENAIMWNDLLLCIEMVIFASILMCAFPTSEFEGGVPESRMMNNVKDVLKIKDVMQDVYHNFMPVYQVCKLCLSTCLSACLHPFLPFPSSQAISVTDQSLCQCCHTMTTLHVWTISSHLST
jgi:hypothetical protein